MEKLFLNPYFLLLAAIVGLIWLLFPTSEEDKFEKRIEKLKNIVSRHELDDVFDTDKPFLGKRTYGDSEFSKSETKALNYFFELPYIRGKDIKCYGALYHAILLMEWIETKYDYSATEYVSFKRVQYLDGIVKDFTEYMYRHPKDNPYELIEKYDISDLDKQMFLRVDEFIEKKIEWTLKCLDKYTNILRKDGWDESDIKKYCDRQKQTIIFIARRNEEPFLLKKFLEKYKIREKDWC